MNRSRIMCFLCGLVALGAQSSALAAGADAALTQHLCNLVSSFYRPYLSSNASNEPPDDADVVAAWAAPSLKHLLEADEACAIRTQGICHLDFGIILNAQDWALKRAPTISVRLENDREVIVRSQFVNDDVPTEVDYIFTRISGRWLIEDMTGVSRDGPWRLTMLLSGGGDTSAPH